MALIPGFYLNAVVALGDVLTDEGLRDELARRLYPDAEELQRFPIGARGWLGSRIPVVGLTGLVQERPR